MDDLVTKAFLKTCKILRPLLIQLEKICQRKALQSSDKRWSRSNYSAQFLRVMQFSITASSDKSWPQKVRTWMHNIIELDIRLREVVQRETFLTEQCHQLSDPLPSGEPNQQQQRQQLDEWNAELQTLNQDYWCIERKLSANDILAPTGPYSVLYRAYISTRSMPQWYLCEQLREDCSKRGGCCGRACRCCEKPRSAVRSKGHGHCTKTCSCCLKSRGFELYEEQ